ncbi:MAG: trypsin-like serine protease [Gemmatimonadetes bacterium]|uniref:Trypsin-like serine protease n=1 Tax=Candidatus Kutchimonas denitrificans TaxID=3056748 RepID=A0AAE4Z944_9BACT|nr:trypsin-like serine protease [Gemmatimonadota bacterium]NIR76104.1 trypsin-like serine protease [Candidatus Kutchimonas denitrificans]NIS00483.1 trypsin-like serine protease [Gemmatimonadota bacterium]NIT66141.1 trypsin-like serine protease [Gemmatimonadota bacterium]NIU54219.1 trypsin-like serine protease [Gemmatimonadota bacterium]
MRTIRAVTALLISVALSFGCSEPNGPPGPPQNLGPQFINQGEPTGPDYGNVGALLFDFDDDGISVSDLWCSGSLIAENVFLTAAHCLAFFPGDAQFWVSFDPDLSDGVSGLIQAGGFAFDPQFGRDFGDSHDIGVVLLPVGATDGIDPLELPEAGELDRLARRGGLIGQLFVNVGYGAAASADGPLSFSVDGKRKVSESPFMGLTQSTLGLLMNSHATDEGGDCFGDSGSPKFLKGDRDKIYAIVNWGDIPCRATSWDYRLDTSSARDFLGGFVELP